MTGIFQSRVALLDRLVVKGLKTLKEEKGFVTVSNKEMKITYKLDWIVQITISRICIRWLNSKNKRSIEY